MSPRFIVGHGLQREGAAHDAFGFFLGREVREGFGLCACGALSSLLPSIAARKRWHKEHKEAIGRG